MRIFSKRDLEGYVRIDHRESPGLEHPLLGKGTLFEAPTYSCPYCQRQVVVNPLRTREREYCRKLDCYICDPCGAQRKLGVELKPIKQIITEYLDNVAKGKVGIII